MKKKLDFREDPIVKHAVKLVQLNQQKKYDEELKLIESVFDKKRSSHWYNKGNVLYCMSKTNEALECYDEAIKLDNRYVKAWYRKGMILFFSKKYSESSMCFEKVIELEQEKFPQESKDWSAGAWFYCMMTYMNERIECNMNKIPVPDELRQKEYYWVMKVKELLELNNIIQKSDDLEKFLDYCHDNLNAILDKLEPNIVLGFKN